MRLPRLSTDRIRRLRSASSGRPADPAAPRLARNENLPLVVVAKIANALRLTALDDAAAAQGLSPGMALTDARAMLPGLDVVHHDEDADRRLLLGLADWCERFTPFVALDPPDGLFLDITGASHLVGGEAAMRGFIVARLSAQGFAATVAVAGTQAAARALCRFTAGGVVAPNEEPTAVGPLPVCALDADPQTIRALERAGLNRIRDVAARPSAPLVARFGASLVEALERILGRADTPLSPRRPPPVFSASQIFADPVADHETVLATLAALAATLARVLEREGEGARRLEASFFRADGATRHIAAETGLPVRDPALMTRLFRERLDALADPLDPGFGFDLIRLAATETAWLAPSAVTFDSHAQDEAEIAALVDRLGARFGPRRVVRLLAQDTHVPEASAVAAPAARHGPTPFGWTPLRHPGEPPARPLRLFTPPEAIEALAEVPDGPPARFRWRRAWHQIAKAEGPERIAMEWWRIGGAVLTRDYFRVEDEAGRRFWLYRDGLFGHEVSSPRWFLHGLFA